MGSKCTRFAVLGLALILFLLSGSCAMNPVSGGPELMFLSDSEEIQLGKQTDVQVRKQYGVYEDQKLSAYLNDMCQRLAKVSHRPNLPYKFEIVDASAVNAFAVPGGYVYFTRGILANLNNEAELAGVMGHEIGHITARHSAQQYSRAQLAQFGLVVGGLFMPDLVSGVAQMGVGMLFLRFSRDNERQADELGVEYASRAGYDGKELAAFFETLERMNPGSDRSVLPGWFSTHPSPEDRVVAERQEAREWQQKLGMRDPKENRDVYLRHIDGLVYGDDPRQGYVDEGGFYHPDMKIQFPVPGERKRVIVAGYKGAYGQAVVIDHGDGLATLYGHASKLLVRARDVVLPQQKIALVGSTGRSTGAHLHFEVIRNGNRVEPQRYLTQVLDRRGEALAQ